MVNLVVSQSKVLSFTRVPNPMTDGEPQAITYATNDTNSPVSIILKQGAVDDLEVVDVLTSKYGQLQLPITILLFDSRFHRRPVYLYAA